MSIGVLALAHAKSQLGVAETTGQNDGPVEKYTFGQQVAWCAFFVAWCYRMAGFELPGNKWLLGNCQYMQERLALEGWVYDPSTPPLPGDIVFFRTRMGSDPSAEGRHVGLVEKVVGDELYTIEGNTSNRVARRQYKTSDRSILAYGRIPR